METSPPKQARLAPVNLDEIEYECSTPRDERFSPETSFPALTEAQNYSTVKQHHVPIQTVIQIHPVKEKNRLVSWLVRPK